MTTALDIATDVLQLLQVYAPGEVIDDADAERVLSVCNDMLDDWSTQSLACYAITEQTATFVPGKAKYTIGTSGGADINLARPIKILDGYGRAYSQDSNGNNYQMDVVPQDQWNLLGNRTVIVQSTFPDTLFYDPQFPLGTINVYPTPTLAIPFFWDSNIQLTQLASLSATFSFPPGYKRAVVTNLAVAAKPYFKTAQIDPLIVTEAAMRLGNLKRSNLKPVISRIEPELVARGTGTFNIYTGGPARGGE